MNTYLSLTQRSAENRLLKYTYARDEYKQCAWPMSPSVQSLAWRWMPTAAGHNHLWLPHSPRLTPTCLLPVLLDAPNPGSSFVDTLLGWFPFCLPACAARRALLSPFWMCLLVWVISTGNTCSCLYSGAWPLQSLLQFGSALGLLGMSPTHR